MRKQTLREHVTGLHIEESFVLEQLKAAFAKPICVVWNAGAKTENAVYDLPCNGKRWLLVAVRGRKFMPFRVLTTIFAVNEDRLPRKDCELLFGKRMPEQKAGQR